MPKRLIICCDGTWQSLDNDWPTNVQRMAQFIKPSSSDGMSQIVYYDSGIGTYNFFDKLTGGAFGHGLDHEIREAYRFLSVNYEAGDEIFLFGFSRGAYTVRSLAGLIYCCGIVRRTEIRSIPRALSIYRDRELHPDDDEAVTFREKNSITNNGEQPTIKLLGCWDTVGALGIPDAIPFLPVDDWLGEKYEFHDIELGKHIEHARHAVAIDERRKVFDVTKMIAPDGAAENRLQSLEEVWFAGTHGCVGGGERAVRGLSDCALLWMIGEASQLGMEFDQDVVIQYTKPNPLSDFDDKTNLRHWITRQEADRDGPTEKSQLSGAALERLKQRPNYRPGALEGVNYLD